MASRFLLAGTGLLLLAWLRGAAFPRTWAAWRPIALLGLLNNALYLGTTAVLLVHISAGMGAVLASTNPLMLALVAPWALGERLTRVKTLGLVVSYAGVAWVMWSRIGSDNDPLAMVVWLVSVAFLVAATILFKRWRLPHDLVVINGGQALAAGIALAVPALVFESLGRVRLAPGLLLAQGWLVVVISMGAMLLWLWLLQHGDATRASAWWFLNPVLGLGIGALVLGEPLGLRDLAGGAVVAAGIYMVQRATRPPSGAPRSARIPGMKTLLVLLAAMLAAGCALDLEAAKWQKPQTTSQQVTAVEQGCARQAFQIGPGWDLVLGGMVDAVRLGVQEARQASPYLKALRCARFVGAAGESRELVVCASGLRGIGRHGRFWRIPR